MKHFKQFFVFALLALFSVGAWGADPVSVTINFGTTTGYWAAHSADGTNDTYTDTDSRVWTRTCAVSNRSGQAGYSQFGNASNACTSLEFSATAGGDMTVSAFSVTMTGASGGATPTTGTIYLYKRPTTGDDVQLATASVSGTTAVVCAITADASFSSTDKLVVAYVGTVKAIRVNSLSYTYTTSGSSTPTCATPTFSVAAGAVVSGTTVELSTTTEGATIHYTTNGVDPTTSDATYSTPIEITSATTIKAMAVKSGLDNSSVATAAYTIVTPLTTMDEIFDAATAAGSTPTDVYITFDNWQISAVKNKNAFVTDGTKGAVIYENSHGFVQNNILSGTVACKVQLYNGFAELTALTVSTLGLTVTTGTDLVPIVKTIDQLSAVNTSALVTLENLTYDGTQLSDGVNTIKTYTTLYSATLESGKKYNITGIYQYYQTAGQILPRSAADIEEIVEAGAPEAPVFSPVAGTYTEVQNVTLSCATDGATIYYTTDGTTPTDASTEYTAAITVDADMTIKAIAIKDAKSSSVAEAAYEINLPANPEITCTWDLSTDSYVKDPEPSAELIQWTSTYVAMKAEKNTGSTGVNNYIPTTRTSTRFYTGNKITFTPNGKEITTIVITAATSGYATALKNATWTNATAGADDVTVTITAEGEGIITCVLGANTGVTAVTVNYKDPDLTKPATPTFSVTAGTYTSVQSVELSCATDGATIYYTTDGTTPTDASTEYTAAITVDADMTIKAIAIKDAKSSNIAEAAYEINLPVSEEVQKTWDLTIDETATASADELTWTATYVDMSVTRGTAAANNYYPGTEGKSYAETRIYNGATLTITPNGKQITSIVIEAGNGTPFKNATWTNGVVAAEGNTVTITVSAPGAVVAEFAANAVAYSVQVNYGPIDASIPDAPTFTPAAGTYTAVQTVEIECATAGATIYYTTDGSTPDNTSTEYTGAITVDATMTIKAIAVKETKSSSVATAAYTINLPVVLTTMQAIYEKAAEVGNTETEVTVAFDNWVVSGVKGDNAYVTDGTKGFIIYTSGHGFSVNDKLNGSVTCNIKLYRQSAELLGVAAADFGAITNDGVVTPVATTIDALGGVNTGAPIIVENVKFDGTNLTDGINNIQPYTSLYDYSTTFVENNYYNVTGIYLQYDSKKEILPRSAADIEELASTAPTMAWYVDNLKSAEIAASHTINVGDAFAPYFETNSTGALTYSSSNSAVAEINATTGELTLKGVTGATVISCAVEADATYLADSKNFTLNVIDAVIDNVVILVQFNDGVEDKWLAMNHDKESVEVNYSAGKIWDLSTSDQAAITWRRTVEGDNVTFQDPSTDNYLKGSTSTTLSVSAGASGNYQWTWNETYYRVGTQTRTFLYQGTAAEFKNFAVSNAGKTTDGGYSQLPVVTVAVFDATPSTPTADYTRDDDWMKPGELGTICISHGVASIDGANVYELAGKDASGNVVFASVTEMAPGKPYLFEATANKVDFYFSTEAEAVTAGNHKGMYGTFSATTITDDLDNTYYFAGHTLWSSSDLTSTGLSVPANRAYIKMDEVPTMGANPAPGKRYITLGVNGKNATTDLGNVQGDEVQSTKVLINGQLYILRGEKMYDATGRLVK